MIRVIGETDTLKRLKSQLGINKLSDYTQRRYELDSQKHELAEIYAKELHEYIGSLEHEGVAILSKIKLCTKKVNEGGFFIRQVNKIHRYILERRFNNISDEVGDYTINIDKYVNRKVDHIIWDEQHLLNSVENIYYGAMGEEAVVKEVKNMSADGILINDFKHHFNKPISMKGGHDWISNIQIDHIFVNEKGIFLIETKNWSQKSNETFKFGPVEQLERTGHAFYFYLKDLFQSDSHFNNKKTPTIFKVVVYTSKNKVFSKNKFIRVLYLRELQNFISSRLNKIGSQDYNYIGEVLVHENEE